MKTKRAGIFTKIIIAVLLIYSITSLISLRAKIAEAKSTKQILLDQIEERQAKNAELQYSIDNSDSDDVIEGVARDDLNMVYPDEKVYHAD